uniref:Tomoregulin-1 n=1 Tax=Eptatretus burgeri TaxID=7764 RepID=A0A8C4WZI8_EPTBU
MVRAASFLDAQYFKRMEHGQTALGRQWQTTHYSLCQEAASAAPTLCKRVGYDTPNQINSWKRLYNLREPVFLTRPLSLQRRMSSLISWLSLHYKYFYRQNDAGLRSCDNYSCRYGGVCTLVGDHVTCICQFQCPYDYSLVCGSNGETFQNECFLRQAACKLQQNIRLATDGPCYAGKLAIIRRLCVCNIDCMGYNYNPVCASNGLSYDNPCLVREASCLRQERIDVRYLGQCSGEGRRGSSDRKEQSAGGTQMTCPEKFKEYCTHGTCAYTDSLHEATCQCDSGYTGHRCDKELNILYVIPSGEKLHYVLIAAIVGAVQIAVIIAVVICIVRKCGKRRRGRPQKHSLGHFNTECGPMASSLMI